MEMKTNEEGKTIIDVIPIGDTMRLQVIADGFQTFGQDYKIERAPRTSRCASSGRSSNTRPIPMPLRGRLRQPAECAATKYDASAPKAVIFLTE